MINLAKSKLLVEQVGLLGFEVREGKYHLGKKALSKLLGSTIP